jgi:hypothetical protein
MCVGHLFFYDPMPLFPITSTQTMHFKSIFTTTLPCFPKEHYTLAGFEPGSYVLQAGVMTTAPSNKGNVGTAVLTTFSNHF